MAIPSLPPTAPAVHHSHFSEWYVRLRSSLYGDIVGTVSEDERDRQKSIPSSTYSASTSSFRPPLSAFHPAKQVPQRESILPSNTFPQRKQNPAITPSLLPVSCSFPVASRSIIKNHFRAQLSPRYSMICYDKPYYIVTMLLVSPEYAP